MLVRLEPEMKRQLLNRLRRVEGQFQALQRLIDEDADCETVVTQLGAACAAARAAARFALAQLLVACLETDLAAGRQAEARTRAVELITRLP